MNKFCSVLACLTIVSCTADSPPPTEMVLGDVIRIGFPTVKSDIESTAFETVAVGEVANSFRKHVSDSEFYIYKADRGGLAGDYMTVWSRAPKERTQETSNPTPFSSSSIQAGDAAMAPLSDFIDDGSDVSDFALVGSDQIDRQTTADILGLHFLKVLPERVAEFEDFIKEELHPALVELMPGMPLLYYKGISGPRDGDYLLIFAIETVDARELYFPTNQPETDALYAALMPLKSLGMELTNFLEPGSWLDPSSGGAAAYFESVDWTDFVRIAATHGE